jgi:two-component system response regulator FlrC
MTSGPLPIALSSKMKEALAAAEDVAAAPATALLLGESGTGKEVLARYIHRLSPRSEGPWVAVNCAALPEGLLESELFGHERGAFTGASERRCGKVELADKGTLLLDEVSELPVSLQAKLLRVLQEREVDRVGGQKPIPVDVRVIATSNRDLEAMVAEGKFRADLFYRINVFPISLPPLRERREDLPALCAHLLSEAASSLQRPAPALSEAALGALCAYRFPGNVRELGNLLQRALLKSRGAAEILPEHLGLPAMGPATEMPPLPLNLAELERWAIDEALRQVNGNRTHAAQLLGIGLRTLRNKLREYREENASASLRLVSSNYARESA